MSISLLRPSKAYARLGMSRSSFYSQISEGLLPRPVSIGSRSVALPDHEIDEVIKARLSGKTDDEIKALVRRLEASRKAT